MKQYTYIVTFVNGNIEEFKASSKKAARTELERLYILHCAPKLKYIRKKY